MRISLITRSFCTPLVAVILVGLTPATAQDVPVTTQANPSGYVPAGTMTEARLPADIHRDSLARLPRIERDDLEGHALEVFDHWVRPGTGYGSGLRGPVGMWMYSPELARAVFDLRERVRYGTDKDQRLTELVIISTAREIDNQYEYSAHEPLAEAAGLEPEIIELVKYRRPLPTADQNPIPGLGETERLLIQFTREVISDEQVSSATFETAIDLFGEEGVMDLVGLIGYYNFVAITLKAFDLQRPPGSELLLPMPAR